MTDAITPKANSVENMVKRTITRKLLFFCVVLINAFVLTACSAKNPEMVSGLSVEVLNYSQEAIISVKINGTPIGGSSDMAKIGGVMGGGSSCCSGEISSIKPTANVTVESVRYANGKNGKIINETYTTQAVVELPFPPPELRSTLIVHILPGRKVVLEVAPGATFDREDLLESQLKALGLKREVPVSDLSRTGPYTYRK
jgi:hypothetical protein